MNDRIMATSDKQAILIQTEVNTQVSKSWAGSGISSQPDRITVLSNTFDETSDPQQMLKEKVTQLNKQMQSLRRDLQFTVDENSGESVIKVIDSDTKEVIRQIPSEEVLKIRESIDNFKGLLFKSKV